MRKEEINTAELVTKYILALDPSKAVSYSEGEDPPDAYLHYDNTKIPLEITTTEIPRNPVFGEPSIRELTYEKSHENLITGIENEARKQDILNGVYVISFQKPLASEDFSTLKKTFETLVLSILNSSSSASSGFSQSIVYDYHELAWIYKASDTGARIFPSFNDGAWTESPEFVDFYRSVITKSVSIKIEKLSPIYNSSDCILAINNSYALADLQAIKKACKNLPELAKFHSVFIIQENSPIIVHSICVDWI